MKSRAGLILVAMAVSMLSVVAASCGDGRAEPTPTSAVTPVAAATTAAATPTAAAATPTAAAATPTAAAATPVAAPPTAQWDTSTVQVSKSPKYGGTWNIPFALAAATDSDPHRSLCCAPLNGSIRDRIVAVDIVTGALRPELAEGWDVSDDHLTYTLRVRQGVYWENEPPVNGRELTAEDVAYTLMRIAGKVNPDEGVLAFPRSSTLTGMQKAEAVGRYTVRVTMDTPNVGFLAGVADGRNQVVPKELVDQYKQKLTDGCKANTGSGPFLMDDAKCQAGVGFLMVRNRDYWGTDIHGNKLPYMEAVQGINMADRPAQLAALAAGQLDMIDWVVYSDAQEALRVNPRLQLVKYRALNQLGWYFNVERDPFSDVRVRQALNLAVSRQEIGNTYHGAGNWFTPSWVPQHFTEYAPPLDEVSQKPGMRANKTEDLKRAKELLAEAGFPNGFTLKISAAGGGPGIPWGFLEIPQIMQRQLQRDLGDLPNMKVEIDWRTGGKMSLALTERTVDTGWWGWTYENDPGLVMHILYHSEGGRNYGAFSDPVYDRLWAQQQQEFDPARRKAIFQQMSARLDEQVPMALMIQYYFFAVTQPEVKSYNSGPFGSLQSAHNLARFVWLDR